MLFTFKYRSKPLSNIYTTLLACAIASIVGCSTTGEPSEEDVKTVELTIMALATDEINPNSNDRPSPVRVDLYQLDDKEDFLAISYDQLSTNEDFKESVLDTQNMIIKPNGIEQETLDLLPETNYLGVATGFYKIDDSEWRNVYFRQAYSALFEGKNYLYLKINASNVEQISKSEMVDYLKIYHENNPEDSRVNEFGRFTEQNDAASLEIDLSKGILREEILQE